MDCNGVGNFFLPMQKQKKYLLQNHTLLQTFCFCSKYYLTLSHLTLHLTSHLTSPHLSLPHLTLLHLSHLYLYLFEPCNVTPYEQFYFRHYTLLWIFLKKYFSILQNKALLQTVCFCSDYFAWTLQCYTLQTFFISDFSFPTLQYYTLQTVC